MKTRRMREGRLDWSMYEKEGNERERGLDWAMRRRRIIQGGLA
jgi:hypothetical protein